MGWRKRILSARTLLGANRTTMEDINGTRTIEEMRLTIHVDVIIFHPDSFVFERPKDSSNHSGNRPHSLRFQGEVFEAGKVDVPTEGILEVFSGREK